LLHVVRNKSLRTPVIELCRNFNTGTLPLPQLHQFQLWYFCLVHKYLHCNSQLPVVFSKYFTLNNDIHHYNTRSTENLHLTRVSTAREARNVKFKASQLWNTLPEMLKCVQKLSTSKKCLKHYLLTYC